MHDQQWFSPASSDENWFQINEESVWFDESDIQPQENTNEKTNNEDCGNADDSSVYAGARLSVAQSAILILTFALRHNITGECFSDLLTLISLHCITTAFIHQSLYKFRTYFSSLKSPIVFHKFCVKCERIVDDRDDKCTICNSDFTDKNNISYFIEIPLLFQLQQLFSRLDFHLSLLNRFSRKKKHQSNIEDIYDGDLYKRFSKEGGFLDSQNNISFMWYTDGVPLFKSSKVSVWPLFLSVNELPIQERFKQENMLFAGLWFGRSKPAMSCFLRPFHHSLKKFQDIGCDVYCSHCEENINVKGILLCGTCDLPAKAMVMNMTQFNGKFGCPKCKQEGTVIQSGKGHTRVFPFDTSCFNGPKRTHEEFVRHGDEAHESSEIVYGVKGPSWWANVCPDIINGTAIDYMHSVLLGLVRRLLQLWFDPKYSNESFSVSSLVNLADKRLSAIRPPHFIQRHPRDIKEQSKYWKASECRAWLFFYSVPVLFGILKEQFFQHFLLLVESIYILNLDSISIQELNHCEEMLIKYCCMFSALYGDQHMSANLHQMVHLTDTVKHLGPLWVYSCFSFESLNGKLVSLFHGTQNPIVQIANAVSCMLKLPALSTSKIVNGTEIHSFYSKLNSRNYHNKITETIFNGVYILGRKHLEQLNMRHINALGNVVDFAIGNCYVFYRLLLNGEVYHCIRYNTHSRNSCTVVYLENGRKCCGQVLFYVNVNQLCHCMEQCRCKSSYFAIVKHFITDNNCFFLDETDMVHANLNHIKTGKLTETCIAIPVECIQGLGVFIEFANNKSCVILRPNSVESD